MKIHILGSGTCVPSLERKPSSLLVEWEDTKILVDAGTGTMHQLLRLGKSIDDIDAIVLTHFHLDHSGELAPFLFSTKYPEFSRTKPLKLIGGKGLRNWFHQLDRAFNHSIALGDEWFDCLELGAKGEAMLGELKISYDTMAHKPESLGYRFEDPSGFTMVYSGDTDLTPNLPELAQGADLLICECAMPEGHKMPGHLTPSLAGRMAAQAKVKHLVLTHFYPLCEGADMITPCKKEFSGTITLARDLMPL